MPEYRQNPLTGRTVIVAAERATRPHQFDIEDGTSSQEKDGYRNHCPFCEGNEAMTPGELEAFRPEGLPPDSPGWSVRSIPNKYPAVARQDAEFPDVESFLQRYETSPSLGHFFHRFQESDLMPIPGVGNHEVLVDTPRHVLSVSDMNDDEVENMLKLYQNRLIAHRNEGRWAFVQIFKNVGSAAGASIPHAHSQLIAMPFIPEPFLATLQKAGQYAVETTRQENETPCFWCDMLRFELTEQKRIVEETEHFLALCPFVSRFAAEVELYPKRHEPGFDQCSRNEKDDNPLSELARLLRRTVRRLEQAVSWMQGDLSYNFVLHTEPFFLPEETMRRNEGSSVFAGMHWHLSILPSLARAAGFEWGTGLHINPIPPEYAAEKLRAIRLNEL